MSDQNSNLTPAPFATGTYQTTQNRAVPTQRADSGGGFEAGLLVVAVFVVVAILASVVQYH